MKERSTNNCLNLLKILHIPSHSTRTEYGSRTTIKGRNKEFSLTLEGAEHVLIISLRIGFMMRSPALVRPPKKTKASGEEKAAKSAQASPSILPVNSYTRSASLSPLPAATLTS